MMPTLVNMGNGYFPVTNRGKRPRTDGTRVFRNGEYLYYDPSTLEYHPESYFARLWYKSIVQLVLGIK